MTENIVQRTSLHRAIAKEKDGIVFYWVEALQVAGIHQRGIMQLLGTESDTVRNTISGLEAGRQITPLEVEILTEQGPKTGRLITESDLPKLLRKVERSKAKEEVKDRAGDLRDRLAAAGFKLMVMLEIAPQQLKQQVEKYAKLELDKANLERQLCHIPTAQDRLNALRILKVGGHKKEYIQRVSIQMAKSICPDIEAPASVEMASLPTAKALLTPTQVAEELKLFFSSGKGNAIKVNKLLSDIGYQEKIQGQWSATEKAIKANLCDRKPVETNSRTQKDQLLWSADITTILKEHILEIEK
jgi:uncharacterized protein (UPF0335 family)